MILTKDDITTIRGKGPNKLTPPELGAVLDSHEELRANLAAANQAAQTQADAARQYKTRAETAEATVSNLEATQQREMQPREIYRIRGRK